MFLNKQRSYVVGAALVIYWHIISIILIIALILILLIIAMLVCIWDMCFSKTDRHDYFINGKLVRTWYTSTSCFD